MERNNSATVKGGAVTLLGEEIRVGQDAPRVKVLDAELNEIDLLESFSGKVKLVASVPSLDTPICDLQIKRFNDEAAKTSKDVVIMFISMDLPFAQKRFCQAYDIKNVKTFSDHKDADFGEKYGVLIKELRLLSRTIFIIDRDDKIQYVEYVKELTEHPNYEKALTALKSII